MKTVLIVKRRLLSSRGTKVTVSLVELTDTEISDPQNGDELVYRDGIWRNE